MTTVLAFVLITVCSATALMMLKVCLEDNDLNKAWTTAMSFGANFAIVVYWIIQLEGLQ